MDSLKAFSARYPALSHLVGSILVGAVAYGLTHWFGGDVITPVQAALFATAMFLGGYDADQGLRLLRQIRPDEPYLNWRQGLQVAQIWFVFMALYQNEPMPSRAYVGYLIGAAFILWFFGRHGFDTPPATTHLDPEKLIYSGKVSRVIWLAWPMLMIALICAMALVPWDLLDTATRIFVMILFSSLAAPFGFRAGWHLARLFGGAATLMLITALLWA